MHAARDEPGEVGHVNQEKRANLVRDLAEPLEIDDARISRTARDDQARLVLAGKPLDLLVVDKPILAAHAIMNGVEPFAGHVRRGSVRQVAARVDAHAEDGIAGLQNSEKDALVGLAARVGLHIREVAAEHLFRAVDRQVPRRRRQHGSRRNSAFPDSLRRICW